MRGAQGRLPHLVYDQVKNLLRWQVLLGFSCVAFFLILDPKEGYSSMLAAAAVGLPNLVYWITLRVDSDGKRDVLRAGYRMMFLVANLVIVMTLFEVEPLGFFVTMGVVQLSFVLGLLQKG